MMGEAVKYAINSDGMKINAKTGLPMYCYRRGRKGFIYLERNAFRVRMPELSDPMFWTAYESGMEIMDNSSGLTRAQEEKFEVMARNVLDQYFYIIENGARRRAKVAGREYTLPRYWGADQYVLQEGRCALSGLTMQRSKGAYSPYSPSIDRIDSSLGYTPENCQLTILHVNTSKKNLDENEFVFICRSIVANRRKTDGERMGNTVPQFKKAEKYPYKSVGYFVKEMIEEHFNFGAFQWLVAACFNGQSENKSGILEQGAS